MGELSDARRYPAGEVSDARRRYQTRGAEGAYGRGGGEGGAGRRIDR